MRNRIVLAAVVLFVASALVAQAPNPADARNEVLDMIWEADDSELLDLYRGFAEIENDPAVRAFVAGLLETDEAALEPPAPFNVHPIDARNRLIQFVEDAEDRDVVALAGYLSAVEAELDQFAVTLTSKTKKPHDDCLDHLPQTLGLPGMPGVGRPKSVTVPTAGLIKACEKQAPIRCGIAKRLVRRQIKKNTGRTCRFD